MRSKCLLPLLAAGLVIALADSRNRADAAGWAAGPALPSTNVRGVGVYFPLNQKFYVIGGRASDAAGSENLHPFEYDTVLGTWATKTATFDSQVNNMAGGVLTFSGTPYIFAVGGSQAGATTATSAVRAYDPVTDTFLATTFDAWPGDISGTVLPGGFTVYNNALYIFGGFNLNVASVNGAYRFDPNAASGSQWTTLASVPAGIMYAPTATVGNKIYIGGGSDYSGGTVIDTTQSYVYDPVANTFASIAAIPRATGETRAAAINGEMWVLGGGRVAPNPSTEVDAYSPVTDSWRLALPFTTARRNFAVDTDGRSIFIGGGYDSTGVPVNTMEIYTRPGLKYFTLAPCRLIDTRRPAGTYGGPALAGGGAQRSFPVAGQCGVPSGSVAISVNVTVVGPTGAGDLRAFASGTPVPGSSLINFRVGRTRANNAILAIDGPPGSSLTIQNDASTAVTMLLDINGYFAVAP